MDHPLTPRDALIRPWRRATVLATAVAAAELLAIVTLISLLVAGHDSSPKRVAATLPATKPAAAKKTAATAHAATKPAKVGVKAAIHRKATPATHPAKKTTHAAAKAATKPVLSRASTAVTVLNGSGRAGIAHTSAASLQRLGYKIAYIGNAAHFDSTPSVVMYRPGYEREAFRAAKDLGIGPVSPLDGIKTADLRGAQVVVKLG